MNISFYRDQPKLIIISVAILSTDISHCHCWVCVCDESGINFVRADVDHFVRIAKYASYTVGSHRQWTVVQSREWPSSSAHTNDISHNWLIRHWYSSERLFRGLFDRFALQYTKSLAKHASALESCWKLEGQSVHAILGIKEGKDREKNRHTLV